MQNTVAETILHSLPVLPLPQEPISFRTAGVGALKGPKHGGANIKVMEMIEDLKANVPNWENENAVREYLIKPL